MYLSHFYRFTQILIDCITDVTRVECNENDDHAQINQNYDNWGLEAVQITVPSLLTAKSTVETGFSMRVKHLNYDVPNMHGQWSELKRLNFLDLCVASAIRMKLFKSKKCSNNNNNVGSNNSGSTSTISCVPGKSSSLNKAIDAKTDTATTSSTTVSGKKSLSK